MKYTLGLDLGITSIGWAIVGLDEEGNSTHIIDANVTILESIEDDSGELKNVERREARGARRTIRRRRHRVKRVKHLLTSIGVDSDSIFNIQSKFQLNPYYLKVKGLEEKLSGEELAICLIHYAKHRGFQSNRKNKEVEDEGDLLTSISDNKHILEDNNITVSQFLYNKLIEGNNSEKIKNTTGNYQFLFDRQTYKNEIEMLLNKQIEFNVINEEFKDKYIDIWSSQRDFSEGPAEPSPYTVDFSKVFGYCKFEIDGERQLRAPKCSVTAETFRILQKFNDIRYKNIVDGNIESEIQTLNGDEVAKLLELAKSKTSIKYSDVAKMLGKEVEFLGLDLNKDKFRKLVADYKVSNNLDMKENINFKEEAFLKLLRKEKNKIDIGKMDNYNRIKSVFTKNGHEKLFSELPVEYLDDIVTALTFYKTENRIMNYFNQEGNQEHTELDWNMYPLAITEIVPKIKTFNESANLSLKLMRKLNVLLLDGYDYTQAMEKLGYDHSAPVSEVKTTSLLPDMSIVKKDFPNELTNPRVVRVLAATMALMNSIIKKYGMPTNVHVETARDIANKRNKRGKIFNENMNNFENNQKMKVIIAQELGIKPIDKVTKDDIEKLKLFYEQNEQCMYSFEKIKIDELFTTKVQVDHIIPYSKCFDNSFSNKTLVLSKYNQDKGNRIPYDYFKQDRKSEYSKFVNLVESNFKLSQNKKLNYLADEIGEGFKSRSLNDTSFITKYFIKIIDTYLELDGKTIGYKAGIVNSLKKSWRLEYLTHSLINPEYSSRDVSKFTAYTVNKESVVLEFDNILEPENIKVEAKLAKINDKTPEDIIKFNKVIENILKNPEFLKELHEEKKDHTIYSLYNYVVNSKSLNQELYNNYVELFNYLVIQYNKLQIKKNRDNHLHHVLDAVCVAVLNRKFEQRVTKFYQEIDEMKDEAKVSFDKKLQYVNKYTGASVKDFEELAKDIDSMWVEKFPKPYDNFDLEVKYRIYEQDEQKQKELFKKNFDDGLERSIRPVFPVYKAVNRKSMKLHKDTYYGCMEFEDGKFLTKRKDVKDLKRPDIAKIVEIKRGNKQLENLFNDWFNTKTTDYPMLPNGRPIKKVKVIDKTADKSIQIAEGKYVGIDKVARIDVYKSPNDDKLYFIQQNPITLAAEKSGKEYRAQLWWGQGKNVRTISSLELKEYLLYKKLIPGELINLKTKTGESVCYVAGFTSGNLEVRSTLGDGVDLIHRKLSGKVKKQYKITTSTIELIEKVKINNLGEIGKRF